MDTELILQSPDVPVTEAERKDTLRRVYDTRSFVLTRHVFFGVLLSKLSVEVSRKVPAPMGVSPSGKVFVHPDWALHAKCSASSLATVLVHEVLHVAMLTWARCRGRDAIVFCVRPGKDPVPLSLWNIATDYANNQVIKEATSSAQDILVPVTDVWPPGLYDARFERNSAEEIYDILLEEANKNEPLSVPGDYLRDLLPGDNDSVTPGGDGQGSKSDDLRWRTNLIEAAMQHEKKHGRGSLPAGVQSLVKALTEPTISWVDALSRWIGEYGKRSDFSWSRPSRRSDAVGEYLPTLIKHGVDNDVMVLWDTSGSMHGTQESILTEVKSLCADLSLSVQIVFCDAEVAGQNEMSESDDEIVVPGGGGSDFKPAFEHIEETNFTGVVIAFTDGYILVPDTQPEHLKGVLWVIVPGGQPPAAWGHHIMVDENNQTRG